jgi:hypothetical protein
MPLRRRQPSAKQPRPETQTNPDLALPFLTEEQQSTLHDYITCLAKDARRAGRPKQETVEKAGITWSAGVHADGQLWYLCIEEPA